MQTLAVMNQKGGAGKTTTTVNLAAALGELRKKVLVLDLDPQASATAWLGVRDGGRGLFDALANNGNLSNLAAKTDVTGVDLIPSSNWMTGIDKALASEVGAETILRRSIQSLPDNWNYLLIDCPPSLGTLSISALTASTGVIVPVAAQVMPVSGLAALLQTIDLVKTRLNPTLELSAILVCRMTRTNLAKEIEDSLRSKFGPVVLKTVIRESIRLAGCPSYSQPITTYDSKGTGAEDYRAMAKELLKRWKVKS